MRIIWCQSDGREMWRSGDKARLEIFVARQVIATGIGSKYVGKPFSCPWPGFGRTIPGEAVE